MQIHCGFTFWVPTTFDSTHSWCLLPVCDWVFSQRKRQESFCMGWYQWFIQVSCLTFILLLHKLIQLLTQSFWFFITTGILIWSPGLYWGPVAFPGTALLWDNNPLGFGCPLRGIVFDRHCTHQYCTPVTPSSWVPGSYLWSSGSQETSPSLSWVKFAPASFGKLIALGQKTLHPSKSVSQCPYPSKGHCCYPYL